MEQVFYCLIRVALRLLAPRQQQRHNQAGHGVGPGTVVILHGLGPCAAHSCVIPQNKGGDHTPVLWCFIHNPGQFHRLRGTNHDAAYKSLPQQVCIRRVRLQCLAEGLCCLKVIPQTHSHDPAQVSLRIDIPVPGLGGGAGFMV